MKKLFMKFTSVVAAIAMFTATAYADVAVFGPVASTSTASIIQKPARVQQILFSNSAAAAVTLTFYDAPTNVLTYVVGAYTNNVYSLASTVSTYTNLSGVVNSTTNTMLVSTLTPVTASTNNYRTLLVQTVPASSTVTFTPPISLPVGFGLAVTPSATNVAVTVTYLPTL
jgi:hypothetical protein